MPDFIRRALSDLTPGKVFFGLLMFLALVLALLIALGVRGA
jgi:hypothetical protein